MNPAEASRRVRMISPIRRLMGRPEFGPLAGALLALAFFAVVTGDRGSLTSMEMANYLELAAQLGLLASTVNLLMIAKLPRNSTSRWAR